ncbi:MAG TPA: response regulator [Terriglobia bacterium]|nr:response regulator [Terriglobia bacterium]
MPLRIMVVDDEKPILDLLRITIESDGYEVLATQDSEGAAALLKSEKFDGLFADVRMPKMNGFELTKVVRGSPMNSRIPVVLITGLGDVQTMREGFQAGASCFLAKPVGPKEVSGLVRALRGAMLKERRRHARLPFRTAVSCQVDDQAGRHFETVSLNIGEGGMLLNPDGGVEVGQRIKMDFALPEGAQITNVHALVVRKDQGGSAGIEFVALPLENLEAIRNFIIAEVAR